MKSIQFYTCLFIITMFLSGVYGCIGSKYKKPDLPEWVVGTLSSDDTDSRIAYIDGKKATGTLQGEKVSEFPDTVILAPGFHQITPCYTGVIPTIYGDILRFYVQEQQEYVLRHKVKWDKTVKFWIEHKGIDITTE